MLWLLASIPMVLLFSRKKMETVFLPYVADGGHADVVVVVADVADVVVVDVVDAGKQLSNPR